MDRELPRTVGAAKMIAREAVISGQVSMAKLARVVDLLADSSGHAWVELAFAKDDEQRWLISGNVSAECAVFCQRCLKAMPLQIEQEFHLALVSSDGVDLPEPLEPCLLRNDSINLHALVEDEMLLALPMISMHPEHCNTHQPQAVETTENRDTRRPFADLADMLNRR